MSTRRSNNGPLSLNDAKPGRFKVTQTKRAGKNGQDANAVLISVPPWRNGSKFAIILDLIGDLAPTDTRFRGDNRASSGRAFRKHLQNDIASRR